VCAEDVERTLRFMESLSYGTRYFRFGRGDFRLEEAEARCICSPNPTECVEFIVLAALEGDEQEVASGRYCLDTDGRSCEFALVVGDEWQGHGIARWLIAALVDSARRRGLARMYGRVLATNRSMIALAQRMGFRLKTTDSRAVVEIERMLDGETMQSVSEPAPERTTCLLPGPLVCRNSARRATRGADHAAAGFSASCRACPWAPWANRQRG
jgi:RimJ/RimL family protein N-acetyltransferase